MLEMISHYAVPNSEFPLGWSFDMDHGTPRLVFRKKERTNDSACFIYYKYDLQEHLQRQCLTTLEYLEGLEFYKSSGIHQRRETALMAIKPRDIYYTPGAEIQITRE